MNIDQPHPVVLTLCDQPHPNTLRAAHVIAELFKRARACRACACTRIR